MEQEPVQVVLQRKVCRTERSTEEAARYELESSFEVLKR